MLDDARRRPAVVNGPRRRAVFLDRDGVLNRGHGPRRPPVPAGHGRRRRGSSRASPTRAAAWPTPVGCSSSSPTSPTSLAAPPRPPTSTRSTQAVVDELPIDEVVVCPHDDVDGCACRKPRPGMLVDAAERLGIDLAASAMVGDRWRDIDAGQAAGVETFFVDHGYDEALRAVPDHVVASLAAAADVLLGRRRRRLGPALERVRRPGEGEPGSDLPHRPHPRAARRLRPAVGGPRRPHPRHRQRARATSSPPSPTAARRPSWSGIELSAEGVRHARAPACRAPDSCSTTSSDRDPLPDDLAGWADVAVCSEVLEHVDDPARFLRVRAPSCSPRRRAGDHRARWTPDRLRPPHRPSPPLPPVALRQLIGRSGLRSERVAGAGFPFFNLYKLVVLAQGDRLATEVSRAGRGLPAGDRGHARRSALVLLPGPQLPAVRLAAGRRRHRPATGPRLGYRLRSATDRRG